jgi:hypothetical protein
MDAEAPGRAGQGQPVAVSCPAYGHKATVLHHALHRLRRRHHPARRKAGMAPRRPGRARPHRASEVGRPRPPVRTGTSIWHDVRTMTSILVLAVVAWVASSIAASEPSWFTARSSRSRASRRSQNLISETSRMADDINRQDAIRAHDRSHGFSEAVNEATIKAGEVAIKTLMLINGGAAVSVLAFIGGLVGQGRVTVKQMTDVSTSLLWFAGGVALAALALGFSYFANFGHVSLERSRIHTWQHPYIIDGPTTNRWWWFRRSMICCAIAIALSSLVAFIVGIIDVRASIIRLGQ